MLVSDSRKQNLGRALSHIAIFKSRSITRNLVIGLVIVVLAVSAIAISLSYFDATQRARAQLEDLADQRIASITQVLEVPLWNLDKETIQSIGESYSQGVFLTKLSIVDSFGNVLYAEEEEYKSSAISRESTIFHEGQQVGYVEIVVTSDIYTQLQSQYLWASTITVFVNLVCLLIFVGFLLRRLLSKPLQQLNEVVSSYASGDYDSPKPSGSLFEFQPLVDTLGEMGAKIKLQITELEDKEAKYRNLTENLDEVIYRADPETFVPTYVNRSIQSLYGYTAEEWLKNPLLWEERIHPDDKERVFAELVQAQVKKTPYIQEYRIVRKDKTVCWVSDHVTWEKDEQGNPVSINGMVYDITKRKQAEEEVKQLEEYLRLQIERMPIGLITWDTQFRVQSWNPTAERIFGFTAEETLGKHPYDIVVPKEAQPHVDDIWRRLLEGDETAHSTNENTTKDGHTIICDWSNTPLKKADGTVVGVLSMVQDITESKQAEEKIKQAAEEWRTTFDSITDLVFIADNDFRLIRVNKAFADAFNMKPVELIDKHCYEVVHGTKEPVPNCPHKLTLETKKPALAEFFEPQLGIHLQVSTSPIFNEKGEIVGSVHIMKDITERKQAEDQLRESEAKFRSLAEQSPNMIFINKKGQLVYANEKCEEIMGYKREEFYSPDFDFLTLMAPEFRDLTKANFSRHMRGEHVSPYEYALLTKDGRRIDVILTTALVGYEGETAIIGILTDITERKKTEERLKNSEERFKVMFEFAPDAYFLHDIQGSLIDGNKMMEQITGYKRDELIGKNFAELGLLPPEELPTVANLLADNAAGESTGPAELTIKQKSGDEAIVEIRTYPTEIGGQNLVLGIGRDITERKRMQEQLIVTDRLASVGELASGIAHELNNPLTGVIGLSQLLAEKDVPGDIKEDLKLVYSEAQRAANVVRNLLTFARRHAPARQLLNVNDVVSKVLELRAYEQRVSNIEVVTHLAPDLPQIMADYFQLQQVFLNIVINAEHFMLEAHNKGTLTITTKKVKGIVRISFADDGPGIPKENLGHIFDPFFTTKVVGKGTGLGLSISYGIVTAHGGQIYAESKLGKGATFVVDLPIR